ncbi:MAG TPA: hypothetical protein VF519_06975 [Mycobacteriales bacterium]
MTRALAPLALAAAALLGSLPANAAPDLPESPVKLVRGSCPTHYYELGWVGTNHEYSICQRHPLLDLPPVR